MLTIFEFSRTELGDNTIFWQIMSFQNILTLCSLKWKILKRNKYWFFKYVLATVAEEVEHTYVWTQTCNWQKRKVWSIYSTIPNCWENRGKEWSRMRWSQRHQNQFIFAYTVYPRFWDPLFWGNSILETYLCCTDFFYGTLMLSYPILVTPDPGFSENSILGNDFKRTHSVNCTSILVKHE